MILSSQFPVNLQAILKIEKFWTIKNDLIMTFSHVYADDTRDFFPFPKPNVVWCAPFPQVTRWYKSLLFPASSYKMSFCEPRHRPTSTRGRTLTACWREKGSTRGLPFRRMGGRRSNYQFGSTRRWKCKFPSGLQPRRPGTRESQVEPWRGNFSLQNQSKSMILDN